MARKTLDRKQLRAESDAAEAQGKAEGAAKPAKKAAPKRKSRAKAQVEVRLKLFWGVFDQSMRQKALYDFSQKKQAEQKAQELSTGGKNPHFVQKVKREVTEEG